MVFLIMNRQRVPTVFEKPLRYTRFSPLETERSALCMKSVSVYLDLIFLTNVLFDAAMLMLTAGIRRTTVRYWRIIVASIIGATYSILMFFPELSILFTALSKIVFSLILVYMAFGFRSLQHYLRNVGIFYLIHF